MDRGELLFGMGGHLTSCFVNLLRSTACRQFAIRNCLLQSTLRRFDPGLAGALWEVSRIYIWYHSLCGPWLRQCSGRCSRVSDMSYQLDKTPAPADLPESATPTHDAFYSRQHAFDSPSSQSKRGGSTKNLLSQQYYSWEKGDRNWVALDNIYHALPAKNNSKKTFFIVGLLRIWLEKSSS